MDFAAVKASPVIISSSSSISNSRSCGGGGGDVSGSDSTSNCGSSSKILNWTGENKLDKHIFGSGLLNKNWGPGLVNTNWGPGPGAGKYKYLFVYLST